MEETILVAGGAGRLGRQLAAAGDARIRPLGRSEFDLSDEAGMRRALANHPPLAVINAAVRAGVDAAEGDDGGMWDVNAVAPGRLARACGDLGIPMIHISTDYVFGAPTTRPWREVDPISPVNAYGRMKAAGEQAGLTAGGRTCVVRVAWLFGFEDDFISRLLRTPADGKVRVAADQVGSPTPVAPLAMRLIRLVDMLQNKASVVPPILHVAGSPPVSRADWVEAMLQRLHAGGKRVPSVERVPMALFRAAARRPHFSALDCSCATALFGADIDWSAS
jgi:dTDP-4-dehydrorhamnose reductase